MFESPPTSGSSGSEGESPSPASESDQGLILKVQSGDVAAFDQLVEKYKTKLYGMLYHMLGNHEDAADLSQEAFLKAFKSIASFRNQSSFYSWLYRIGMNVAINFLKRRKEVHLHLNPWHSDIDEEPILKELTSKENVHQSLDRAELLEKLNEALQKLSNEHRAVVVLHDIEGVRHQEIAKVLGCSEATARSRLFYAHQQLQALLANYL